MKRMNFVFMCLWVFAEGPLRIQSGPDTYKIERAWEKRLAHMLQSLGLMLQNGGFRRPHPWPLSFCLRSRLRAGEGNKEWAHIDKSC